MEFTDSVYPRVGAVISGKSQVTSTSFHHEGQFLFVASESDRKLRVVNCRDGKQSGIVRCEREGITKVEATHHNQCVLFSGKGSSEQAMTQRYAVNYLSVYDNKILRKFRGHSDEVESICVSPADDCFLTSSKDRTVRLWSLQKAGCVAEMELPTNTVGTPFAAFDYTGLVFGVCAAMAGGQGHYVHLFDARNYTGGAFAEMQVKSSQVQSVVPMQYARNEWTGMAFNANGNQILIKGSDGLAFTIDGYEGTPQRAFCGGIDVCYTPDDKSILTGHENGTVQCWNVDTGASLKKLEGHPGRITSIVANPKYTMFASCCTNTALWIW